MRFVKSPYFSSRGNYNISLVVIHTTVGFYEGTIKYFQNNDRLVSSHYVVKEDGSEVCQMVDESYRSHHAGIVSNPNPKFVKKDNSGNVVNPNNYSIGIENADNNNPNGHDRTGQYKALAILVRDICKRWNIPIDRDHICGHRELYDKKTCPANLDVDKVVQLAKAGDFNMDDDTKRALEQIELAKAKFAFGNRESTIRGLIGMADDLVAVRGDLQSYKDGEKIRIESAVNTAITENNKVWQSQLDTANKTLTELKEKVDSLVAGQAENLSYSILFSIAWKKFWKVRKGGE